MDVDEAELEYKMKVMQKCKKGRNYKFKDHEKIICVLLGDIIRSMPTPTTPTGRTYVFEDAAISMAHTEGSALLKQLQRQLN